MPIRLPFGKVFFGSQAGGGGDRVHPTDGEATNRGDVYSVDLADMHR
jgi:hypothetical protein